MARDHQSVGQFGDSADRSASIGPRAAHETTATFSQPVGPVADENAGVTVASANETNGDAPGQCLSDEAVNEAEGIEGEWDK